MTLLRRRASHRSCFLHGDNGCDVQGEAGPRTRAQDVREWRADVDGQAREASEHGLYESTAEPRETR